VWAASQAPLPARRAERTCYGRAAPRQTNRRRPRHTRRVCCPGMSGEWRQCKSSKLAQWRFSGDRVGRRSDTRQTSMLGGRPKSAGVSMSGSDWMTDVNSFFDLPSGTTQHSTAYHSTACHRGIGPRCRLGHSVLVCSHRQRHGENAAFICLRMRACINSDTADILTHSHASTRASPRHCIVAKTHTEDAVGGPFGEGLREGDWASVTISQR